jgi:hypothetical protein
MSSKRYAPEFWSEGIRQGRVIPDLLANTPKVAFLKHSWLKNNSVGSRLLCPFRDRIVNGEH